MSEPTRLDPELRASEAEMLQQFLDYHRATVRIKTADLDAAQLGRTLGPSTMTLGGIMKHLALVEDYWFSVILWGNDDAEPWREVDWDADGDWEWNSAAHDTPEHLHALFEDAVAHSDRCIAEALTEGGLDHLSARESRHVGGKFTLRWIMIHLIEEYARHNGHADLLREAIDGVTGE